MTEDRPTRARSPYARTKRMMEQVLEDMAVATADSAEELLHTQPGADQSVGGV